MLPNDFFCNFPAMGVLAGNIALSLALSCLLAGKTYRRESAALVFIGFLAALLKIALVQQAPQWLYVNPDSIRYMQHSSALALHWSGSAVDPIEHALNGLLAMDRQPSPLWLPTDHFSYSSVLGTHEWLYAAYLAGWRMLTPQWTSWVLLSQASLCALFPTAACGIARSLGARDRAAYMAAFVCLIDPSAAVNASWLLKDTLACFIVSIAVWAAVRSINARAPWLPGIVLALSLPLLGTVRYATTVALILGAAVLFAICLAKAWALPARRLIIPLTAGLLLFPFLYSAPNIPASPIATLISPLQGEAHTLAESKKIARGSSGNDRPLESSDAADDAVISWRRNLHAHPLEAAITSVAHTLFAPYPWVPFTVGLGYKTGMELYYPGVFLWIFCLPFLFIGTINGFRKSTPQFVMIMGMLGALLCAYTVFLGEWSTRQRVFILPVIFAIAAIGFDEFMRLIEARKIPRQSLFTIEK